MCERVSWRGARRGWHQRSCSLRRPSSSRWLRNRLPQSHGLSDWSRTCRSGSAACACAYDCAAYDAAVVRVGLVAHRASYPSRRAAGLMAIELPQRIVSLVPSTTESVCELGAAARLLGCTRYCTEPEPLLRSLLACQQVYRRRRQKGLHLAASRALYHHYHHVTIKLLLSYY